MLRPNDGHNRGVINWLDVELWCTHDSESPEAILMCCSKMIVAKLVRKLSSHRVA